MSFNFFFHKWSLVSLKNGKILQYFLDKIFVFKFLKVELMNKANSKSVYYVKVVLTRLQVCIVIVRPNRIQEF